MLEGGFLSMITDYDFDKKDSPDAKQIIKILGEMHFEIQAKGKFLENKKTKKNCYIKRALLAPLG